MTTDLSDLAVADAVTEARDVVRDGGDPLTAWTEAIREIEDPDAVAAAYRVIQQAGAEAREQLPDIEADLIRASAASDRDPRAIGWSEEVGTDRDDCAADVELADAIADRIVLRSWEAADEPAYEAIVCTPEVAEYLGEPDSDPVPQGRALEAWAGHMSMHAAVTRSGEVVGMLQVAYDDAPEVAYVTVAVRPDLRGQGIGRAAVAEAGRFLRLQNRQVIVGGLVKRDNEASVAMVRRLGGTLVVDPQDASYFQVGDGQ